VSLRVAAARLHRAATRGRRTSLREYRYEIPYAWPEVFVVRPADARGVCYQASLTRIGRLLLLNCQLPPRPKAGAFFADPTKRYHLFCATG
jgi:hypothetical protein